MISISSKVDFPTVTLESFNHTFSDIQTVAKLFSYKNASYLTCDKDKFSFLLKRVAEFEFTFSKEKGANWVQFNSTKKAVFKSAMRFEFLAELNELHFHFETDTNIFMELFLEKRIKNLMEAILNNVKNKIA